MRVEMSGRQSRSAASNSAVAPQIRDEEQIYTLRPGIIWSAYRSEHAAFIAMCIYLFFEYVKPEQQYAIFGILPFLKLSIFGAMIGFAVDKQSKFSPSTLLVFFTLFLSHCVVSSVLAYRPDISFSRIDLIYIPLIVFILITSIVNNERRLFLFLLVYFVSNLRMSEFGFFSWVRRGFSFASYGVTGAGWFRNSGELGMQMAVFFSYTICFVFFLRQYWKGWVKWLMYFLPISAVGCIVASSSRGAIIGAVGSLIYLSIFTKRKFRTWAGVALLGCFGYLVMPSQFLERFQTAGKDETSLTRIYYWEKAREMLDSHPSTGVGYFNWVPYFKDHYFDPDISHRVEEAHNTYLQIGAELGYPGLILFAAMILISFWMNWRSEIICRRPGFEFLRSLALGMNAACTALVLSATFLTATYLPSFWVHFGLTVSLRLAIRRKLPPQASKTPVWRRTTGSGVASATKEITPKSK